MTGGDCFNGIIGVGYANGILIGSFNMKGEKRESVTQGKNEKGKKDKRLGVRKTVTWSFQSYRK